MNKSKRSVAISKVTSEVALELSKHYYDKVSVIITFKGKIL